MGSTYKPTVILTGEEKRMITKLKVYYQDKNIDDTITMQKTIAMAISDTYIKVFGKKTQKKQTKKGVSSPAKGDDMAKKIKEFFVKSDKYMSSQDILRHLGLPNSDGRKLAPAMKALGFADKKIKTGKIYFCQLKD